MRKIYLRGKYGIGKYVLVDDEDYEELNKYKWRLRKGYATRDGKMVNYKKGKIISMHREIMKAPLEKDIDHKDRNKLNNCKSNLRFCDMTQNLGNQKIHRDNTSGFKGVYFNKNAKKWQA